MRQTPVNDYLEEISTELPEELYGRLSDAIYETVCEFDEEVAQLKAENVKLRELVRDLWPFVKDSLFHACPNRECCLFEECNADFEYECPIEEYIAGRMRELGVERWSDDS